MATITEAIYENGVLRLVNGHELKEHQRYRVIVEEIVATSAPSLSTNPALAAELERRTTVLPDGRKVIALYGLFERGECEFSPDEDIVTDVLNELRQERAKRLDELVEEIFPQNK